MPALIVATLAISAEPSRAQVQPERPEPSPPAISSHCQTPGVTITGSIPLLNVQRALNEKRIIKILAIGASSSPLMRNTGETYFKVIEGVLEKTIPGVDVQISDRGVSGEIVSDTVDRIKTEVALDKPDLVLWQVGGSDAVARVPVDRFEAGLDSGIAWLKQHNVDVVLVGMQFVRAMVLDQQYQLMRGALQRVVDRHQVLRIGRYEASQVIEQARGLPEGEKLNQFAATEQGNACLSEYVVKAITTGIFLRPPKTR